jgi:hypothetical protein
MTSWIDKMHRSPRTVGLSVACLLGVTAVGLGYQTTVIRANVNKTAAKSAAKLSQAEVAKTVANLPLGFEPNRGQTDPQVKYLARARGYTAFLKGNETVLRIKGAQTGVLAMELQNAQPGRIVAADQQVGKSNYLIGQDRSKWLTNVPNYGKVAYEGVYPGVDVVYSGNQRDLEYDFVVKPGADPSRIHIAYKGSSRFELNAKGDLELQTAAGPAVAQKPVVYQTIHGQRQSVQGEYVLTAKNEIGFKLGAYDASQSLVIDPTLTVLTYFGGTGADQFNAVAANATGVYLTGSTASTDLPVTPYTCPGTGTATPASCVAGAPVAAIFPAQGGYSGGSPSGGTDAFVTKLTTDGTTMVWSIYLGGSGNDSGNGIAVDNGGNAYVAGTTASANFPVTNGSALLGGSSAFATKVATNGQSLVYSLYFGANLLTGANAIALDGSNNAYLGGFSTSTNLVLVNPISATATACASGNVSNCNSAFVGGTKQGAQDGLVVKLDTSGTVQFSSLIGATGVTTTVNGITIDSTGGIDLAGTATGNSGGINAATRFPTTASGSFGTGTASNFMASATAGAVGFVTRLTLSGTNTASVSWSDTLGAGTATANALVADSTGRVYVAGSSATAWNLTTGANTQLGATAGTQNNIVGAVDNISTSTTPAATAVANAGYVIALASGGKTAAYATFYAPSNAVAGGLTTFTGIALDSANQAYVSGTVPLFGGSYIVTARLNAPGAIQTIAGAAIPGAINFTGEIQDGAAATTVGTGIAVLETPPLRSAFVAGYTNGTNVTSNAMLQQPDAIGAVAVTTAQNYFLNGTASATLAAANRLVPNGTGAAVGGGDGLFAALTFRDLVVSPTAVSFTASAGGTAANLVQTVNITPVGGGALPCSLGVLATSGAFFANPSGGSAAVNGNNLTLQSGTQTIPALGAPVLGTVTVGGATGCPFIEPATIGISYSSTTSYTVTPSQSLSFSTPILTQLTIASCPGAGCPTVTVTAAASVATTVTVVAPTGTGWVACTPFTVAPSGSVALTGGTAQTYTLTPAACIGSQTTPGTYTGTISVASTTSGQAATATVPYSITITPALQGSIGGVNCVSGTCSTLTFPFSSGSTAAAQQSFTLSANGASLSYTTSVTNGTFPAGALSVVAGASGTIASGGNAAVVVQVNPTGLANGQYAGSVVVTSGSQTFTVPVVANVGNALVVVAAGSLATATPTASFTSGALSFNLPANQTFSTGSLVINGTTSTNITLTAPTVTITTPVGGNWLSVTGAGGCPGTVNNTPLNNCTLSPIAINTTGLAAGSYSGTINVASTTSGVSGLVIPVNLTVTTSPVLLQGTLRNGATAFSATPVNLLFAGAPGQTLPLTGTTCQGSQTAPASNTCTLMIATNAGTLTNVTLTPSGSSFLLLNGSNAPLTGQTIGSGGTTFTIQANTLNLTPNKTYTASIGVSASGASFSVPVTLTVLGANPSGAGIFRPQNGLFLLDSNFNRSFDGSDIQTLFSGSGMTPLPGDIAVAGDWSGTGTTKIGLYRPSAGTWFLDYNGNGVFDGPVVDRQYQYGGLAGDIPVVGDWNGTGYSKVGLFRAGFFWILNTTCTGAFSNADSTFAFGGLTGCGALPGVYASEPTGSCDIPVTGDWNGSGTTKVGLYRAAPGTSQPFLWVLDTTGAQAFVAAGPGVTNSSMVFAFGGIAGDVPIVGDWSNTGATNVGVFRSGFFWVENTTFNTKVSATGTPAAGDTLVGFGFGGIALDQPVVGRWR